MYHFFRDLDDLFLKWEIFEKIGGPVDILSMIQEDDT